LAQSKATEYEQELNLLGLWHRHPGSMDTFSGTDGGTNRTFASLNPKGAISGLVNVDPKFRFTLRHVSTPLHYKIVEVEVGDDLIPKEYFKLKYEPSQGLNPQPPQKTNPSWTTKKRYEIKLEERYGNRKEESILDMISRLVDTKNLFLLISIVGFFLSMFVGFSYQKLKRTDDIKALYKVLYSDKDNNLVSVPDSIINAAIEEFEEKIPELQKEINYKTLFYNQLPDKSNKDSLFAEDEKKCKLFISEQSKRDKDVNVDSLQNVYQARLIAAELNRKKQNLLKRRKNEFLAKYNFINLSDAHSKVKMAIISLLLLSVISILTVFIPKKNRQIKEATVVGIAFVATLGITFFNPFNPLSFAYFIFLFMAFMFFCLILFCYLCFGNIPLLKKYI
jgi:hypothetical protein